jgi:hypothetical protein
MNTYASCPLLAYNMLERPWYKILASKYRQYELSLFYYTTEVSRVIHYLAFVYRFYVYC